MQPQSPTLGISGSATSGTADTVITGVSIAAASLPQGIYEVLVTTYQVGTADTNYTNMVLQTKVGAAAAVDVHILPSTTIPTSVFIPRLELNGSQVLQVSADAGVVGASSVYVAVMTVTRIA